MDAFNDQGLQILEVQARPGSIKGMYSPSIAARVQLPYSAELLQSFRSLALGLEPHLPPAPAGLSELLGSGRSDPEGSIVLAIGTAVQWLSSAAGLPVLEKPQVFRLSPPRKGAEILAGDRSEWALYVPSLSLRSARLGLDWLVSALALPGGAQRSTLLLGVGGQDAAPTNGHDRTQGLSGLLSQLEDLIPSGVNSRQFIAAAHALDIPVVARAGGIWQFGVGRHSRMMLSTLTDRTPSIGVKIARSKSAANQFLREAGMPVPNQVSVGSESEALEMAEKIGYPVVIKPEDLDGGRGVADGLNNADAVRKAYRRAAALSENIILEKQIEGRDFRLNVFQGKVLYAIERQPGGVTGNGSDSIATLIEQENLDPRRRPERWFQMSPLSIDDEAQELLQEAGLTLTDVPEAGAFVRLRRAANVSRGGTAKSVTETVHEENARLAIRAAAALRLDLAGVDLITPDISRPWHEVGGAICEVNAQVQIGISAPHQFAEILKSFMRRQGVVGNGRVPIAAFVTGPGEETMVPRIARALTQQGATPGTSTAERLVVGSSVLQIGRRGTTLQAVRALMCDVRVDCILVEINDADLLDTGLPFDRFDLLHVSRVGFGTTDQTVPLVRQLAEHCSGKVSLGGSAIGDAEIASSIGDRVADDLETQDLVIAHHVAALRGLIAAPAGAAAKS